MPFTILWKGCKFQNLRLPKWGYGIGYGYVHTRLHMVSYGPPGVWGGGVGDINVLDVSVTYLYHVGTFIFVVHIR